MCRSEGNTVAYKKCLVEHVYLTKEIFPHQDSAAQFLWDIGDKSSPATLTPMDQ